MEEPPAPLLIDIEASMALARNLPRLVKRNLASVVVADFRNKGHEWGWLMDSSSNVKFHFETKANSLLVLLNKAVGYFSFGFSLQLQLGCDFALPRFGGGRTSLRAMTGAESSSKRSFSLQTECISPGLLIRPS